MGEVRSRVDAVEDDGFAGRRDTTSELVNWHSPAVTDLVAESARCDGDQILTGWVQQQNGRGISVQQVTGTAEKLRDEPVTV